jgi:hypothetical protein
MLRPGNFRNICCDPQDQKVALKCGEKRQLLSASDHLNLRLGHGTSFALTPFQQREEKQMQMNEQDIQTKLAELMGEISTLPPSERRKLEKLADETRARHERLRQTVSSLQESLDYLRLSIKYLVFDLEATRRENNYLRKMLEETTGGGNVD